MSVIQISQILERRGAELELPGAPTSLDPLVFSQALPAGQLAFATDSGRLFIGHAPSVGQINYKRPGFPYQNIEVLTEASTDTLRRMFNFLHRDVGSGAYYSALLRVGDGWQDVAIDRTSGAAVPYVFQGTDLIASIEYFVSYEYQDGFNVRRDPLRQGTLRALSVLTEDEAVVADEAISIRRLDLAQPFAIEGDQSTDTVFFRLIRDGAPGEGVFRFQYQNLLDEPMRLYFSVQRPTASSVQPFEVPAGATSGGGLSAQDVTDIVADIIENKMKESTPGHFEVDAVTSVRPGSANTVNAATGPTETILTLSGDVSGHATYVGVGNIPVTLASTGVVPGSYTNASLTVDAKGRITAVSNGVPAASGANLGTGLGVYSSAAAGVLSFRSLRAGDNVSLTASGTEITIGVTLPQQPVVPTLVAGSNITLTPSGNQITISATVPTQTTPSPGTSTPALTVTKGSTTIANVATLQIAGTATLSASSGTAGTAILTIPGVAGAFTTNAQVQTYTGTAAGAPLQWQTVANLSVTATTGTTRALSASAMIGADLSGFSVTRQMRVTVAGATVASAIQPWGAPNSGGQLQIEWQDINTTRTGALPITLDVAYSGNDASAGSLAYSVYNPTLSVLSYGGTINGTSTSGGATGGGPVTIPAGQTLPQGFVAAYALRLINPDYKGPLVKIATQSGTTDIYPLSDGSLDVDTILAQMGFGSANIAVWYDQSGNGHDLTPFPTAMPTIATAGAMITVNSKPAINFKSTMLGTDTFGPLATGCSIAAPFMMNSLGNWPCIASNQMSDGGSSTVGIDRNLRNLALFRNGISADNSSLPVATGTMQILTAVNWHMTGAKTAAYMPYKNGTANNRALSQDYGGTPLQRLRIGQSFQVTSGPGGDTIDDGYIPEMVFYPLTNDQSLAASRAMGSYYGVTVAS